MNRFQKIKYIILSTTCCFALIFSVSSYSFDDENSHTPLDDEEFMELDKHYKLPAPKIDKRISMKSAYVKVQRYIDSTQHQE